jgi:5'-methylthioadenosine phosphorylase
MTTAQIGIIGGSGLYQMPELTNIEEISIDTPFGKPSDAFVVG